MSDRIDAIRRRELSALSPSEQAKVLALTTTGAVRQGTRLGRAADSAADRIWTEAEARVQREETAAAQVRERKLQAKAVAKAERKAKGWF